MQIDRRTLLAALAAAPFFAPSAARAQDMSRVAMAPIAVRERRVWMPVGFGTGKAHWFILDTGAFMNMMRDDLAKTLGLRRQGSIAVGGLGGADRFHAFRAPDVSLGDVKVGSLLFAAYGRGLFLHREAEGLLSAALVTVADTDLDFDEGLWRLHLDGRRDRSGFEKLPSTIRAPGLDSGAAKIFVDAEMDGRSYRLLVDTGSPGDILLGPAAARTSGLWNGTTPYAPHRIGGIGGDGGAARLVRGGTVRLGGIAFERPLVSLTDPDQSRKMDADGLLGIGLIQRMNLSTDVAARSLWAKRNAQPPRPERYGLSGLWLAEKGGGVVVQEVGTGSPAAQAGLRRGDRLVDEASLGEWIDRLGGRPGERVEIRWRRGGESGTARLVLAEYL